MKLGELKVDFMPDDEAILGLSNRWYAKGIARAVPEWLEIRRLTPQLFVATKLEAYRGRGEGDLLGSRDAEEVLLLVDGREEIVEEIASGEPEIRDYIVEQIAALLDGRNFDHFLEGNIRGPAGRADIVYDRLVAISMHTVT